MRQMGRRLRSRYDYAFFQVSNEWTLLLSVAGVIFAVTAILPSSVGYRVGCNRSRRWVGSVHAGCA